MQARYYDPVIGRFMSNDPIGFRDVHSFNRYAYANNNPFKYVDPTGMSSKCTTNEDGEETCTITAKKPTERWGNGVLSYFYGVANYARHESRLTGGEGNGQAVQANTIEKELLGLALQLAVEARVKDLLMLAGQVDGWAVAGRFGSGMVVSGKVGAGMGLSFTTLAAAGDAYRAIENTALDYKLFITTIDPSKPLLGQVPDPVVRQAIKTRLTEVGIAMLEGTL